jgi:hypothetical protein
VVSVHTLLQLLQHLESNQANILMVDFVRRYTNIDHSFAGLFVTVVFHATNVRQKLLEGISTEELDDFLIELGFLRVGRLITHAGKGRRDSRGYDNRCSRYSDDETTGATGEERRSSRALEQMLGLG